MDVLPQLSVGSGNHKIIKLDLKDKRILYVLGANARIPINKIAKKVGLSRDSVKYRIDGYRKDGVLRGTVTNVDIARFGYTAYHIFIKLNNPSKEAERIVRDVISPMPFVRAALWFFGAYDLEIAVIARSLVEFDNIMVEILSHMGKFIGDYEISIIMNYYVPGYFPKSFFEELRLKNDTFYITKQKEPYSLDKKDLKIIRKIANDARMPSIEISKSLGMSQDAVGYRIKRMSESGIISFKPVINYSSIGYTVHVLLFNVLPLDEVTEKKIHSFFSNSEGILWATKTVGRFNILTYACTKTNTELQNIINKLRDEFPEKIKNYEILLASKEYKYTYAPECIFD
ncbi:MAG: Lrp/AsnC family transcriptional regulator [Candidatus Marsarchaeota archaeon]|nr:Lrp/AsnC family transcriptional regulator [Candidatus Marsarchaeota archaeon]